MSTAEAVAVGVSAGLDALLRAAELRRSHRPQPRLHGAQDNPEDAKRLKHYFDVVVKARAQKSSEWKSYYNARKWLV